MRYFLLEQLKFGLVIEGKTSTALANYRTLTVASDMIRRTMSRPLEDDDSGDVSISKSNTSTAHNSTRGPFRE